MKFNKKNSDWLRISKFWYLHTTAMGGGTFFTVGGTSACQKNYRKCCGLNWQLWRHKHWNMTSLPMHHTKV